MAGTDADFREELEPVSLAITAGDARSLAARSLNDPPGGNGSVTHWIGPAGDTAA